jgi:hypothetical protein
MFPHPFPTDTSMGLWMAAHNVKFFEDMRYVGGSIGFEPQKHINS